MKPIKTVNGNVYTPDNMMPQPEHHEKDIAYILSIHFNCDVFFIMPVDDYKRKTPDIRMKGVEWEIKSPLGSSKSTIRTNLNRALKQSKYIVFDSRRTKLDFNTFQSTLLFEMKQHKGIKGMILIDKVGNVIEILR